MIIFVLTLVLLQKEDANARCSSKAGIFQKQKVEIEPRGQL